jgi:hypothetical protein
MVTTEIPMAEFIYKTLTGFVILGALFFALFFLYCIEDTWPIIVGAGACWCVGHSIEKWGGE